MNKIKIWCRKVPMLAWLDDYTDTPSGFVIGLGLTILVLMCLLLLTVNPRLP